MCTGPVAYISNLFTARTINSTLVMLTTVLPSAATQPKEAAHAQRFAGNHCLNCEAQLQGPYCHQCGQKKAHRMTLPHLLHEVVHFITHLDGRFGNTLRGLARNPGRLALNYVQGQRARYFAPGTFLLFSLSASFVLLRVIVLSQPRAPEGMRFETQPEVVQFVAAYLHFMVLATLPLMGLVLRLLYSRNRFSYGEHMVLLAYAVGLAALVSIPLFGLRLLVPETAAWLDIVNFFCLVPIMTWAMSGFYERKLGPTLLRSLVFHSLFYVCFFIVTALSAGIYMEWLRYTGVVSGNEVNIQWTF